MRGFDIRGIGPRVIRTPYETPTELERGSKDVVSDALGGRAYYMGRVEVEFPSTSALKTLGSVLGFVTSLVWKLTKPTSSRPGLPGTGHSDGHLAQIQVRPGQNENTVHVPKQGLRKISLVIR